METLEIILKIFIALVNCAAVLFICIVVTRICRKMSEKINEMDTLLMLLEKRINFLLHKNDVIYLNQLNAIKKDLIAAERYEDIALVNTAIEQERKRIYEYMESAKNKKNRKRNKRNSHANQHSIQ